MIKGFALIGTAILVLCNTAVGTAGQTGEAKAPIIGHAATTIFFGGTCASFPINISSSGSYVLPGNITMPASCSVDAIDVKADNVVLDLGGYTITGTGSGNGIGINGPTHSNVTVKNGSVLKMGGGGISLGASATLEELTASSNGTNAVGAVGFGIQINNGIVHHVHANGNKGSLISGYGIRAISTTDGSEVSDSEASNNSLSGIEAYGNILRNIARNDGSNGLVATGPSTIMGNTVEYNDHGIQAVHPSVISSNIVSHNSFGIEGTGQISNNTVTDNTSHGILVEEDGTSVVGNTITGNTGFGIECKDFSTYGNNQLFGNNETTPPHPASQVSGGVQMGPNICDGVLCP